MRLNAYMSKPITALKQIEFISPMPKKMKFDDSLLKVIDVSRNEPIIAKSLTIK